MRKSLKTPIYAKHQKYSLFSYKPGNSFLHKCPAIVKIFLIPALSVCVFKFSPVFCFFLILFQTIIAFAVKFSVKEQIADLKPIIFYAVLLIFARIVSFLLNSSDFSFVEFVKSEKANAIMLLKLFCTVQSASLFFKTSTSLEIRSGIEKIETFVRKIFCLKKSNNLTNAISLFVMFIPLVSKNWQQAKKAWISCGGKTNLKMYAILLPVLFSVGIKQAYNAAKAVVIRS